MAKETELTEKKTKNSTGTKGLKRPCSKTHVTNKAFSLNQMSGDRYKRDLERVAHFVFKEVERNV